MEACSMNVWWPAADPYNRYRHREADGDASMFDVVVVVVVAVDDEDLVMLMMMMTTVMMADMMVMVRIVMPMMMSLILSVMVWWRSWSFLSLVGSVLGEWVQE